MASFNSYLTKQDLQAIADEIANAEKHTIGEIRVSAGRKRKWREGKLSLQELALQDFHRLGMEKTKGRTGVLLFILFDEHQFQLLADEGINSKVADGTWSHIAEMMTEKFKQGSYREGIVEAVREVGRILQEHFPQQPGDTNELSNQVDIR